MITDFLIQINIYQYLTVRPQFVDTLFTVRLSSNMWMCCAVLLIINYFLVHKIELKKLTLLSTHVSPKRNKVSEA